MEIINKFVEFDDYCKVCKYRDRESYEDPCNECLENPVNVGSEKPVNYKKDEENKNENEKE